MDADIDIEEHDLLENPAIKKIFPDLSILKKEISGFSDEATGIKQEPDVVKVSESCTNSHIKCSNTEEIYCASDNSDSESEIIFVDKRKPPIHSNKIILGSKPAVQCKIEIETENITEKIHSSKICLEDIGLSLKESKRFCSVCRILFPQIEYLETHNLMIHNQNNDHVQIMEAKTVVYKCEKCRKRFSRHGNMIKHFRKFHRSNTNVLRTNKALHQVTQLRKTVTPSKCISGSENKCSHCNESFSSKKSLIEHIYMVLRSNKSKGKTSVKVPRTTPRKLMQLREINSGKLVSKSETSYGHKNVVSFRKKHVPISFYRCFYCSYYFTHIIFYRKHLINKHRDLGTTKTKMVSFDGQCRYCSAQIMNWKTYNAHLLLLHKEKVNNTLMVNVKIVIPKVKIGLDKQVKSSIFDDDSIEMDGTVSFEDVRHEKLDKDNLVLKSVLFKCFRCDIHFLTAKHALNHKDHMELLVNWKCGVCQIFFKKPDEFAHAKQHVPPFNLTIVELNNCDLERVLYKCTKCAIHFSEDSYFTHYETCEHMVAESEYCKFCDFLIEKYMSESHFKTHKMKNLKAVDFTIVNSEVINLKNNQSENVNVSNEATNSPAIGKICSTLQTKRIIQKPKHKFYDEDFYFKLSYCETCKSYITLMALSRNVHSKSLCINWVTRICKFCGLVFTFNSIKGHLRQHQKRKDLKLQDFTFYSMKNRKEIINPPIPQYPKCCKCDVHFESKVAILNHICSKTDFLTCNICDIKLNESVFKLHMSFHYYSKTCKKGLTISKQYSLAAAQLWEINTESKEEDMVTTDSVCKNNNPVTSTKGTEIIQEKHQFNAKDAVSEVTIQDLNQSKQNQISEPTYKANKAIKSDYELFGVLYSCTNCYTTIDTYDKVVEHCQNHLCGVKIVTETCKKCNLVLEKVTYNNHLMFDSCKKVFTLLKFDIFYFTLDKSSWFTQLFRPLSEMNRESILNRSIYRKSKIKMKVIQDGSHDLTVYKCNSCFGIIEDSEVLEKHAETSCFKIRKYPCSICGLPFLSYLARQNHENIHKTRNISLKSYRIVVFNQEKDKHDNMVLTKSIRHFLLFQCRNCNGIVDKYQRLNHECNKEDLRKCETCGLLIVGSDYKSHCSKHRTVHTFVERNIKVVLFGQKNLQISEATTDNDDEISTNFNGKVVDYTFYRCTECEVSFDESQLSKLSHKLCYDDSAKSQCPKCGLFILKKKMTLHTKLHDHNEDFERENMNVIPYYPKHFEVTFVPADKHKLMDQTFTKKRDQSVHREYTDLDQDNTTENILTNAVVDTTQNTEIFPEKLAKLLKCVCGLHFLDSSSIQDHFIYCNPRVAKQSCSKCNLLFTPNVLFDHLLIHHGDKKCNYKFNIIEMSKKKCDIVTLYNCGKCKTHFLEQEKCRKHYEACHAVDDEGRKTCRKCNLNIDIYSIEQHKSEHHKDSVADIVIIDIETDLCEQDLNFERNHLDKTINEITLQADCVIDSKQYNLSEDTLSRIHLSNYDNSVYKCEICNTHFMTKRTLCGHIANHHFLPQQELCHNCGLKFSLRSLKHHVYVHHEQMKLKLSDLSIKTVFNNG